MSQRPRLLQDFDRHVGKPRQGGVIGQEHTAAVFHGRRQVKGVERLESIDSSDSCGSFTICGSYGKDEHSWIAEEGVEIGYEYGVAGG